ncbi:uncharacterized protein [Procambarus clarkii]|uniref:uncharacterized protein isoform X1 n=1 Tax=Procambarus clarkii TaxID=6728 RepID=UPI0037432F6B
MKLLLFSVLLLVVTVNTHPGSPAVFKVWNSFDGAPAVPPHSPIGANDPITEDPMIAEYYNYFEDPYEDLYPLDYGSGDYTLGTPDDDDDDTQSFKNMEIYLRQEQDFMLLKRLMGYLLNTNRNGIPSFVYNDLNYPESSEGNSDDTLSLEDRPIFFNFLKFAVTPNIPNVDDLPDNYYNSTHNVHVVNGTRVEVNTTTNKESEDGFKSFFHHEVIAIHPEDDQYNVTTSQTENRGEKKPAKDEELPTLPEVENESGSPSLARHFVPLDETETSTQGDVYPSILPVDGEVVTTEDMDTKRVVRVPRRADDDAEEVEVDDDQQPPPDLSKDTRVNHLNKDHQGLVKVDPNAEIFNLTLVLEEDRKNADDK